MKRLSVWRAFRTGNRFPQFMVWWCLGLIGVAFTLFSPSPFIFFLLFPAATNAAQAIAQGYRYNRLGTHRDALLDFDPLRD